TGKMYDAAGNPAAVTMPEGNCRIMEYDRINRLVSVTDDPTSPQSEIGYFDPRFTRRSDDQNLVTRYIYDDNGNLRHQFDPRDNHTEYIYNELNRKRVHIQPGNLSTSYTYDEEGNLKSVTDPNNNIITYDYDKLDRQTDAFYKAGKASPSFRITRIHTDYDENSNVTMITETKTGPDGSAITDVTVNNYDSFDRLDDSIQRGMPTDYKYDDNGNRTLVATAAGSTAYTYDGRNRLKTADANGAVTEYKYTQDGKKDIVTYPNDTSIKYNYSDSDRISDITHRSGIGTIISRYDYTYDLNGNRKTQAEKQDGTEETTDYNYDAADRLKNYTVSNGTDSIFTGYT
ncbi:MAG: RHS repeat protein, partial [Gammaproteobacteria bacterium]|nr:RHS repeat protein [Gammaproteobacteria bacterium]